MLNLGEMQTDVWRALGEPSDLDPTSATGELAGAVNRGQMAVAFWKDPASGRIFRHRQLLGDMFFQTPALSGELTVEGTVDAVQLPAAYVGLESGRYEGWVLTVEGESRVVVRFSTAGVATVHSPFSSTPASGDTFSLTKAFSYLLPAGDPWVVEHIPLPATSVYANRGVGNLLEVLAVEDLAGGVKLAKADHGDAFLGTRTTVGTPGVWYRWGDRVVFDQANSATRWYRLEYYRAPTALAALTDGLELDEVWEEAVILWAIEWGFRREGIASLKYSAKQDFTDKMRSIVSAYDIAWERDSDHGVLERG